MAATFVGFIKMLELAERLPMISMAAGATRATRLSTARCRRQHITSVASRRYHNFLSIAAPLPPASPIYPSEIIKRLYSHRQFADFGRTRSDSRLA
jgi:hypothetical protein